MKCFVILSKTFLCEKLVFPTNMTFPHKNVRNSLVGDCFIIPPPKNKATFVQPKSLENLGSRTR